MDVKDAVSESLIIIGVEMDGEELSGSGRWIGCDYMEGEGYSLEELLENTTVFTTDQDGGSGPEYNFYDLPKGVREEYEREITKLFIKDLKNTTYYERGT